MKKVLLIVILLCSFTASKAQTQVDFYTNYGDFRIDLYDSLMPITTGNFIGLVNQKFYDGVIFHRVIDNFMIQGGAGTPVPPTIPDEFDSSLSNIQATISMANAGPNTGTSQFFINLVNNTYLDFDKPPLTSKHPVFGITTSGFDVVQTIGGVATNSNDQPLTAVRMDSVRIVMIDTTVIDTTIGDTTVIDTTIGDTTGGVGIADYYRVPAEMNTFPNPFSTSINVEIMLTRNEHVNLSVYDAFGRLVTILTDEEKTSGKHLIEWGGTDFHRAKLPDGVYFLQLTTPSTSKTMKLMKLDE